MLSKSRRSRLLACLLVPLVLAACATAPDRVVTPAQSPNDDYSYRWLTLDNEMQLLLVSAPKAPKAAASLVVMVGSGDNPETREGLAHFLEHMLFLGTDKYPDAAEYEEYITEHGGSRNAYTSFDHTNYFFDINPEHLPEALDRFAQFFIAPRFDAEYVDREKNAVEAEYQMGLKSDGRRGLDVLQEVMNQAHPYSQFSVGSLDTLDDREGSTVRDELLRFYDKYYSANIMTLAVLGNESLDELEALVAPMFSAVPNRGFEHEIIEAPLFTPDSLPMLVQIKPLATLKQLEVSFEVPDYRLDYRVKPVSYLGNLVGHEGEGSLLSQLKAEGLADSLSAGSALGWRGGSLFSVSVSLTDKGAANHERVLELLFAEMDMLRAAGPKDWLYREQSRLADLGFRYREPGSPSGYVISLATGMHYYAPEDVLRGPYMMDDYDAAMLTELMDYIRPENAIVMLNDPDVITDRVSERYDVPYSRETIAVDSMTLAADDPAVEQLHLPAPNDFIAEDLALVALPDPVPAVPEVALRTERQTIWFMPDGEFRVPKGAINIRFDSTEAARSAEQVALASLYTAVLVDDVNEFAYPARLAGLGFNFYRQSRGITLRLEGYNDKQLLLLASLLEVVHRPQFDARRFEDIRQDMIRALRNSVAKRPSSQVMDDLNEALSFSRWGEDVLVEVLENTTMADLEAYAEAFWAGATAEVLVFGNYDEDVVQRLSGMLATVIDDTPAPRMPESRLLQIGAGQSLRYVVDVPHDDSVVAWYLQGAGDSFEDRAATALSAQIIKSGFFQQLRTEQQLGYVVSAFNWSKVDVAGMVMLIQSPVAGADDVAAAMDTFMRQVIPTLDEEQFERHKVALVSEITKPDKNLRERADFYWESLSRGRYGFDGRESLAAAVEALTLEAWQAYFSDVFLEQRHSLQVVAPGRFAAVPAGAAREYDAAATLKDGQPTYVLYPVR